MNIEIYIECHNCQHVNKNELGMPGFQFKQTRFETFSEAHQHMIENPDHYMGFVILTREDE